MTIAIDHATRPLSRPGSRSVASLARGIGTFLRHRRDYRQLERMDDWLLADMGLTRKDVRAMKCESYQVLLGL